MMTARPRLIALAVAALIAASTLARQRELAAQDSTPQLRAGVALLDANRLEDALPLLREAVAEGASADQAARQILGWVGRTGLSRANPNYGQAVVGLDAARSFPVTPQLMAELDFYLGVALYQSGVQLQDGPVPSCEVARQALPIFQRVKTVLASASVFTVGSPQENTATQVGDGADTYITIQEAVLRRSCTNR
jgi:hypothetical protein